MQDNSESPTNSPVLDNCNIMRYNAKLLLEVQNDKVGKNTLISGCSNDGKYIHENVDNV